MPEPSRAKKRLFCLVTALGCFVFLEGFAYLSGRAFFKDLFFDPASYTLSDERLQTARQLFDPELGWTLKFPGTPYGERPRAASYDSNFLSAFGASFTYCAEVQNSETWQEAYANKYHQDVYNFGVWSYGIGQSFLRFRRMFPKVRSKFVALGVGAQDTKQTMNSYRLFYFKQSGAPLTIPTFQLRGDGLEVIPNPIQSAQDLNRLQDPAFIQELADREFLFRAYPPIRFQFPFTLATFRAGYRKFLNRGANDTNGLPALDLSHDEYAVEVVHRIFKAFRDESTELGAKPFLMLFPEAKDLKHVLKTGSLPESAEILKRHAEQLGLPFFDAVTELATLARQRQRANDFYNDGGHLSALANSLLAESLERFLETRFSLKVGLNK